MLTSVSTPTCCRIRATFATLAVVVLAASCSSEPSIELPGVSTGGGYATLPDIGFADAGPGDQPVRSLCSPGTRRCLFENSPLYEECGIDGKRFEPGSCPAGDMCRDGHCVDFACAAGRGICVGTRTAARCAEDGRSFRAPHTCEGAGDICRAGECIDACEAAARSHSYVGCDYLARELPNLYRIAGETDSRAPFAVVVANPSPLLDTTVSITGADGLAAPLIDEISLDPPSPGYTAPPPVRSELFTDRGSRPIASPASDVTVPPKAAAVFLIDVGVETEGATAYAGMRAYRVHSSRPIIAYQFSPYCCNVTASNDASLLLPTNTLDKRYRVLSYPAMPAPESSSQFPGTLTIVANEDATRVQVDSPVTLDQSPNSFPRSPYDGAPFTLDAGESISLGTSEGLQNRDLSGTVVSSDKDIAVFAGHVCTFVPQDEWACDHLEEQMLPSSTLGKSYVLMPTRKRVPDASNHEAVYWRLLADEASDVVFSPPLSDLPHEPPSNNVTGDCAAMVRDGTLHLDAGQVCEFGTLAPVAVQSSGALIVGGVISGHHSTGLKYYGAHAGDPSFFLAPPVEQFRDSYSFVSPPTFARNYVGVAVPHSAAVALDGVSVEPQARLELRNVELGHTTWDIFNLAIEPGYHTMNSNERFGIIVYAYDDYVSYAFPGGLDLRPKESR